jgi:hypothetical protein
MALNVDVWFHAPGRFTTRERAPGTHWTGYMRHRASLDIVDSSKIVCPCQESNNRSPSPYPTAISALFRVVGTSISNVNWTPQLRAEPCEDRAGRGNTALVDVKGYEIVRRVVCTHWGIICGSSWEKNLKILGPASSHPPPFQTKVKLSVKIV